MLGNLTVAQIEARLGIDFPEETRVFMQDTHQSQASNVDKGRWHCFDLPFVMVCGDFGTAEKIFNSVKDKMSEIKEPMQITLAGGA